MVRHSAVAAWAALALLARGAGLGAFCSLSAPHWAPSARRPTGASPAEPGARGRTRVRAAPSRGAPKVVFRPKQSLGQNYLSDPNIIAKIATSFVRSVRERCRGSVRPGQVVELGPGLGAITHQVHPEFPTMTVVEIDGRAVEVLRGQLPNLHILYQDLLELDYRDMADKVGGQLYVIGNLPYYIVSDAILALVKEPGAVRFAQLMVQSEVAQKMTASPGSKQYGILAATLQLYTRPRRAFAVPDTAFYPKPKVQSAIVELDFLSKEEMPKIDIECLREVISAAFQQRGKLLRHSLKQLLQRQRAGLPPQWAGKRAEQMKPQDFVEVARVIFPYGRAAQRS